MKILFDECLPKRLKKSLEGHDVKTVPEAGWTGLKNGALLAKAADAFDVFITVDRNMAFQQNPRTLPIPVVVLHSRTNRFKDLETSVPALQELLTRELSREIHHVGG